MEIRKPALLTCAAIVVIASAATLLSGNEEHAPVKLAAAPDMFSFIKPMAETPPAPVEHAVKPLQPQASPVPRARDPGEETPSDVAAVEQEIRQWRNQGASDDEVYRLRSQRLSPDAAARLAQMEREETQWQARIELYLVERSRLLAMGASTPGATQSESLQQLRNTFFSAEEQERLAAFEPQVAPQLTMN